MAAPQTVQGFWNPSTSVGSIGLPPFRTVYSSGVPVNDLVMWVGTGTSTTGGALYVNLTADGTDNGPSLFSNILSVSTQHVQNTTTPTQVSLTAYRGATTGFKTLIFFVVNGRNISAFGGGDTLVAATSGKVFQVTVIGTPA